MLINCPECKLQVSDVARTCPHCGYPLKEEPKKAKYKRRRLPNGFGRITKLKQNLRNPYRAMVSVSKDSNGRPTGKILGYYKSYNLAYEALVEYHKNPYDLDQNITVRELYDKWTVEYFKKLKSETSKRVVMSAWKYCSSVYGVHVRELRTRHIKDCVNNANIIDAKGNRVDASPGTKMRIKSLFNLMLDYAVEYELIDRNFSRTFEISQNIIKESEDAKRGHMVYSDKEMEILWNNQNDPIVQMILIQCYSGWRPQELCLLETNRVHVDGRIMKGGMKSNAGINRVVPIHNAVHPLIAKLYNDASREGRKYLFVCHDSSNPKMTYDKFSKRYNKVRDHLGLRKDHRPHDGRKHFVTLAKKYNVDEYAIKRIVGHAIADLTENVYTERDKQWLIDEINKIQGPNI